MVRVSELCWRVSLCRKPLLKRDNLQRRGAHGDTKRLSVGGLGLGWPTVVRVGCRAFELSRSLDRF